MTVWFYLFLGSFFIVFYNYAGYALIVILLNRIRRRPAAPIPPDDLLPSISFIVAAYNEADCIDQKITNSLDLDYPPHKIEFMFISDGSNDATPSIIRSFDRIVALHQPERQGKSAAINRAVSSARHEILIFSDANTILNREAVRLIARHYADPAVGGVAGEKKVLSAANGNDVGDGEGLYWKYESFLKKTDADFYSVVGAAGELFSLRRSLYTVLPANIVLDDFVLSLKVAQQGFRVAYEPAALGIGAALGLHGGRTQKEGPHRRGRLPGHRPAQSPPGILEIPAPLVPLHLPPRPALGRQPLLPAAGLP